MINTRNIRNKFRRGGRKTRRKSRKFGGAPSIGTQKKRLYKYLTNLKPSMSRRGSILPWRRSRKNTASPKAAASSKLSRHSKSSVAKEKKAVFTFGRFQPPHSKHAYLIDTVIDKANKTNADAFLFASKKSNDFDKPDKLTRYNKSKPDTKTNKALAENPLKISDKLRLLKFYHGDKKINIVNVEEKEISDANGAIKWLQEQDYTNIVFMVGADRVSAFSWAQKKPGVSVEGIPREGGAESPISGTKVRAKIFGITSDNARKFVDIYKDIDGSPDCLSRNKMIFDIINLIKQGSNKPD